MFYKKNLSIYIRQVTKHLLYESNQDKKSKIVSKNFQFVLLKNMLNYDNYMCGLTKNKGPGRCLIMLKSVLKFPKALDFYLGLTH